MKRVVWSISSVCSRFRAKRRASRGPQLRSEVLEVRTLMSAAQLVVQAPVDPGTSGEPVDGQIDDSNPDVIFYNMAGGAAPSAIANFTSREEFGNYLLNRALSNYDGLFGQPAWWYRGPIYYLDGGPVAMASDSLKTVDHSETNVQVTGVDEGDMIENDGQHLFVLNGNQLVILQAYPAGQMKELSRLQFEGYASAEYLDGTRLTVISQEYSYNGGGGGFFGAAIRFAPTATTTVVSTFDVSNPSKPVLDKQTRVDGYYVDSRAINGQVHLITSNDLALPAPQTDGTTTIEEPIYYYDGRSAFTEEYTVVSSDSLNITTTDEQPIDELTLVTLKPVIQKIEVPVYESRDAYIARVQANLDSLIDQVLPRYESVSSNGLAAGGAISEISAISRVNGADSDSMLSVISIDTRSSQPGLVSSSSVLASWTNGIYANQDHLYVFSPTYNDGTSQTQILEFAWANGDREIQLLGSGVVDGTLLNQFSADEHNGNLRIATTTFNYDSETGAFSQANNLTILENVNGELTPIGSVDGFADGERIYSVRFDGDRAFVVTFRQVDPLFVFDLADPTAPAIAGELHVPGYSSYLQVIDQNHLLAVGRSTETQSTKVSLYDISDPAAPTLIDEDVLPHWTWSLAEWDSKAVGWFASKETLAIPVYGYDYETGSHNELLVFHVDVNQSGESAIQATGSISDDGYITRSSYIENVLYTISSNSVIASDINNPKHILGQVDFQYDPTAAVLTIEPVFTETDDGASDWEYLNAPETLTEAENMLTLAAVNLITGQVRVSLLEEGGQLNLSLRGEDLRITKAGHGHQDVSLGDATSLRIDGTSQDDRLSLDFSRVNSPNLTEIVVNGLEGADRVTLTSVNRKFVGSLTLDGGDGKDTIIVASTIKSGVQLLGGDGDDILVGGSGNDTADGGAGRDDLRGNIGNDLLRGGDGNDTLNGGAGDDTIGGGAGNDRINGSFGNDALAGGDGNDLIYGDSGNDTLLGEAGNDLLRGDAGRDVVLGGDGDDNVDGGADKDTVSGGSGHNLVRGLRSEINAAFTYSADWLDLLNV